MSHPNDFTDTYDEDNDPFFYSISDAEESSPWRNDFSDEEEYTYSDYCDEHSDDTYEDWFAELKWHEKIGEVTFRWLFEVVWRFFKIEIEQPFNRKCDNCGKWEHLGFWGAGSHNPCELDRNS